jgi:hypothetical protein
MGKNYVIESEFEDLHGNPDDAPDLELDLSDSDNPIISAFANGDEDDWKPPVDEEKEEDEPEEDEAEDDDTDEEEDDSELDDEVEDDEEDEAEDDSDEDEDDDKYSKNVKKRIDRERNLRLQEREEANQRIAKLENRARLRDAQDEFNSIKQEADVKLRKLKEQKTEALDDGETSKVVDIDDEILDIKAELKAKELQLKQTKDEIDSSDDSDAGTTNTPPAGRKWLEKYPQFHTNGQFRNVVLLTDKAVAARGFDKNTSEYYEEMERLLQPQFPKIVKSVKISTKRGKAAASAKKKRSAVGSTTKAGTRRSSKRTSRRGRVRLTKADQQQMEVFGMDPTNPADAKAWAENKAS